MSISRSRTGLGLVAAAAVLLVGFFVREWNGEPGGALLAIAAVFAVLGLKSWLSSPAAPTSDPPA